jgi:hypothetical protein
MTKYALYCIKKELLSHGQDTPLVIVSHSPFLAKPYSIEFVRFGGVVYQRFILPISSDICTTSKLVPATIVFQNNREIIVKVSRTKDIEFGVSIVSNDYLMLHTKEKTRLPPLSICQVLHPKKYFVGFNETEIEPFMKLNLAACK